ncbi:ShlB/FhaC/HecB family hemolysin secretion/activation protein [Cognatilysobacter terrigena]|uniref:ShlB/FhaC/HecB family hemolysin secretion/activation protein n=1 Tax=Cognatilysobacter terrigena TaxID=2488749 RepID=UPI00105CC187|nr:ShlB/FhaC/HecB family hemolysin secretion/activation protein [Lysobacter terrigena]
MKLEANTAARPLARGVAVALGLVLVAPAFAQVAPTRLPGQTAQDVDPARRTPAVPPALIDPSTLSVAGACPFAGKGEVTLTRIDVTGATLVARDLIDAAVADLLGHPADAAVLCTARDRVAAVYARQGEALAAVDIPEQNITAGVLTLRVTEGRVRNVVVENAEAMGPSAALARAYLGAIDNGGATHWSDVERAFLLAREIPGTDMRFALRRTADGTADGLEVIATAAPRRVVDIGVGAHNLGSEELGRENVSLRVDANSFTRFGDRTSLVLSSSLGGEQKVAQLLEEVRMGVSGWTLFGDFAYGRSRPGGGLESLELEGHSSVARLGARYAAVRTRALSVDSALRIDAINQTNDLGLFRSVGLGTIPLFDEKLRVLSFETNARWQRPTSGLAATGTFELRKGLGIWGASEAGDDLLSRAEARPDFVSARLGLGARWSARAASAASPFLAFNSAAQWSNAPLPAYEEFQAGNYTIGRGFDPGAASGDSAVAGQLEAGWDFRGGAMTSNVFAFVDVAHLWNRDDASYDATLRSIGIGARAYTRFGQLALTCAVPQTGAFPGDDKRDARVLFTFNHTFSIR